MPREGLPLLWPAAYQTFRALIWMIGTFDSLHHESFFPRGDGSFLGPYLRPT